MKVNRIDRLVGVALGLFVCVLLAHTINARVIEGFEAGDPAVSSTGDASNQGTFEGVAAPQGTQQYLLTSLIGTADNDGFTDVSGNASVSNASLQTFFFNQLTLTGFRGSGVLIPFTVITAGFGFTIAAMLVPLVSEFDVALGRTTGGGE